MMVSAWPETPLGVPLCYPVTLRLKLGADCLCYLARSSIYLLSGVLKDYSSIVSVSVEL